MAKRGQILSIELLVYSHNKISPDKSGEATTRFLNRLNKLLQKDKKMCDWDIAFEVMEDNTG